MCLLTDHLTAFLSLRLCPYPVHGTLTQCMALLCFLLSVPVNSFQVVISSLPGRRCAGARRSLVADIGMERRHTLEPLQSRLLLRRCPY